MATWNSDNIIITKKGEEVLSKVLAGIGKLTISRVVTGAGYVSPSKLYSLTQVSDIRQELDITSYSTTNEGTSLALRVSNKELESSYSLYQIGIYVTHPDFSEEVLYVIAQCDTDNPDIIPLPSETPVSLNYNFYLAHSGTSDVKITISDSGLVSVREFESYKQEVSTELGKKATKEQGEKADTAVQSINIGGIAQSKVGGVVNLPVYPTSLPANGGNADTLDGKHASDFFSRYPNMLTVDYVSRADMDTDYKGVINSETAEAIGLDGSNSCWWHIIGLRNSNDDGYGTQIAIPLLNTTLKQVPQYRTSMGITFQDWKNLADGGNADTLDSKHAAEFAPYHSYAPIYIGDILDITEMGTYSCSVSDCTNLPPEIVSWCYITMHQFRDTGYKHYICMPLNNFSEILNTIWISSEANKDSSGNLIWSRACDGGNAATVESHPASDFALKTDIPTSLPANGGRSDTTSRQMFHTLGTGTDVLSYATSDNCPSGLNTKVRIMHSPTCPTNYGYDAANNDFWYDIYKLDNSWVTIKAYDVRGNVEFINSRINGTWSGWVRCNDGGNAATANFATYSDYAGGSVQSTASNICLRSLSSGTADVNTTNCPVGAWYGQHS